MTPEEASQFWKLARQRNPTAVHEAGHAVVACAYRFRFGRVVVHAEPLPEGDDEFVLGHVEVAKLYPEGWQVRRGQAFKRLNRFAVLLLAGREANILLGTDADGCEDDVQRARRIVEIMWRAPTADEQDQILTGLRR
jgi:hypothetical protein